MNKEELIEVKFDGACDNNSKLKLMGIGVAVWIDRVRAEEFNYSEMVGTGTSNIAEWLALIEALKTVLAYYTTVNKNIRVRIYGDSQLIVRQFKGVYEVKKSHLKPYKEEAARLRNALNGTVKVVDWIPREHNKEADKLSKKALVDYIKSIS